MVYLPHIWLKIYGEYPLHGASGKKQSGRFNKRFMENIDGLEKVLRNFFNIR